MEAPCGKNTALWRNSVAAKFDCFIFSSPSAFVHRPRLHQAPVCCLVPSAVNQDYYSTQKGEGMEEGTKGGREEGTKGGTEGRTEG